MKKFMGLVLALICFLFLSGCGSDQAPQDTVTDINSPETLGETNVFEENPQSQPISQIEIVDLSFAECLDAANFFEGLSQSRFMSQMKNYVRDKNPSQIPAWKYYDGVYGGGCRAEGELFSFYNDYTATEDNKYANYSNSFYTKVQLDGLILPHGINFEDTLSAALQKLEIDIDLQSEFVSDENAPGIKTLYSDDRSTLELINRLLLPESAGSYAGKNGYELKYTECYQATRQDGRITDVTRQIVLFFADESAELGSFEMSVNERYKINQDN